MLKKEINSVGLAQYVGAKHMFETKTFSRPHYCFLCKSMLLGFTSQGQWCTTCNVCVHHECLDERKNSMPLSCQPLSLPCALGLPLQVEESERNDQNDVEKNNEQNEQNNEQVAVDDDNQPIAIASSSSSFSSFSSLNLPNLFVVHHWIEGNISTGSRCSLCSKKIYNFCNEGYRCSRCKMTTHTGCLADSTRRLADCVPRHAHLLYPGRRHLASRADDAARREFTPVLVFVNTRSGGQQGVALMAKFRRMLGAVQVHDLNDGGPDAALHLFAGVENLRLLVCGGDGTVGWVLSALDGAASSFFGDVRPPVAVLPLGTGNDLARTLLWGGGYEGDESTSAILRQVRRANVLELDRWLVKTTTVVGDANGQADERVADAVMNNYFSLGVDAKVAHDFHTLREEMPDLFQTRIGNKIIYAVNGFKAFVERQVPLHEAIELRIGGRLIRLPVEFEGIIVLNVPSYAGGAADLWGVDDDMNVNVNVSEPSTSSSSSSQQQQQPAAARRFSKPSVTDGLLEVVGITGSFHMGQITAGLSNGIRIAQAREIDIVIKSPVALPYQVDGEPDLFAPSQHSHLTIRRHPQAARMLVGSDSLDVADGEHEECVDDESMILL
jgi:diacylglycerol kinase family enzyme